MGKIKSRVSEIKREWLSQEMGKLCARGISKAEIARRLGMLPQQLNNTLHSHKSVSDHFIDLFTETFEVNKLDLYSRFLPDPEADSIYKRIMDVFNDESVSVSQFVELNPSYKHIFENTLHWNDPKTAKGWAELVVICYPNYSLDWIICGKGSKHPKKQSLSHKQIPLIPYNSISGYGSFDPQDLPAEEYYNIEELKDADFLIRVKGDSMSPKYNCGDIVACKQIQEKTFLQWHKIYAICTRSQGTLIKRIEADEDNPAIIKCVSENPSYKPFHIHENEITAIFLVLGAVVLE